MRIIGEKINGTLKKISEAIALRDANIIRDLARRQVEAGAYYIDVNAGTSSACEPNDLAWLIDTIQSTIDVPLCLDSTNPKALSLAFTLTSHPPMINSISGEKDRLEGILPLLPNKISGVIALLLDDSGIPKDIEGRLIIAERLLENTKAVGVPDELVYIDPLAMSLATHNDGAFIALETMRILKKSHPQVCFALGLSNISFGLPERRLINRTFLTLCLGNGLNAAIMDPMNDDLMEELFAAELVLGRDKNCRNYIKAFRQRRS